MLSKVFNPLILFNIILIISFSFSINSITEIEYLNFLFYIFFHLTFIYFLFYRYHYTIYILALIYGILFDILLLNSIGAHLICFISLVSIYIITKKYLFLLSPNQISFLILTALIMILYSELLLAYLINNIYFTFGKMLKYTIISAIIFIPSILMLNKLDR